MAAVIIEICDAVAVAINAASLSQALTAGTKLIPRNIARTLTAAIADVKPAGAMNVKNEGSRNRVFTDFAIEIGIAKKVDVTDATEAAAKAMFILFDEVDALFRKKRLPGYADAVWRTSQYTSHMSESHMEDDSAYLGVLHIVFGVSR